jgi:RND family efflux transporter MFP subunit
MKKNSIIITVIIVVVIAAIVGTLVRNKRIINSEKVVKTVENTVAVTVKQAEMQATGGILQFVGTADPNKEVSIGTSVAGSVVQVNFKLGDHVNKGFLLAKVDDTYKLLAVENAQTAYNKSKDDNERYQVLRKGDAVTEMQARDARVAYDNAANQLENAKKQLADTRIIAPFSGYITSKNTEVGAYLNVGNIVAGMVDISQLRVVVNIPESNVYSLKQGQKVTVTADVLPGTKFEGIVSNISPRGNSAHTYPVEVTIANNGKPQLKAGAYVNVSVDMGKTGQVLMIPRDAIVSTVKDPSVYIVENGIVHLTKITTGQDYGASLEVVSGLKAGDQIVTNGQINLMDGSKVLTAK